MKDLRHFDDPFSASWDIGTTRQHGASKNSTTDEVKLWVQAEIVTQARSKQLSNPDIINLLSIAEIESGFNPSAATNAHPGTSASGVFQMTDRTAKDVTARLNKNPAIGGYEITHSYERFDPRANIDLGIAYYLDRKRVAGGSTDIQKIYAAWNTNPTECEKVAEQLVSSHQKWGELKELPHHDIGAPMPSRPPFRSGGHFTDPLQWTGGGVGDANANGIPDVLESQNKQPKKEHHSALGDVDTHKMAQAYIEHSADKALEKYPQLAGTYALRHLFELQSSGMTQENKQDFMNYFDKTAINNIQQGNIPVIKIQSNIQQEITASQEISLERA